jgi:hypothetical protein
MTAAAQARGGYPGPRRLADHLRSLETLVSGEIAFRQ